MILIWLVRLIFVSWPMVDAGKVFKICLVASVKLVKLVMSIKLIK